MSKVVQSISGITIHIRMSVGVVGMILIMILVRACVWGDWFDDIERCDLKHALTRHWQGGGRKTPPIPYPLSKILALPFLHTFSGFNLTLSVKIWRWSVEFVIRHIDFCDATTCWFRPKSAKCLEIRKKNRNLEHIANKTLIYLEWKYQNNSSTKLTSPIFVTLDFWYRKCKKNFLYKPTRAHLVGNARSIHSYRDSRHIETTEAIHFRDDAPSINVQKKNERLEKLALWSTT